MGELENEFFFSWPFWIFFFKILFLFFSNDENLGFHMRYHFFSTIDGFFRILEKRLSELICTRLYKKLFVKTHWNASSFWNDFNPLCATCYVNPKMSVAFSNCLFANPDAVMFLKLLKVCMRNIKNPSLQYVCFHNYY